MDTIIGKDKDQNDEENSDKKDFFETLAKFTHNSSHVRDQNEYSQWSETPEQHQELGD